MNTLLAEAEKHVIHLLNENLNTSFVYHNIAHTQFVVEKTKELIEGIQINETDAQHLLIAAWFHDAGYTIGVDKHEEKGVAIATKFLKTHNVDEKDIENISSLILATVMDYVPKNALEKIIRDADCAHLGNKNFSDTTELLRKEWEMVCDKTLTENEWLEENINFLTNKHKFSTDFAMANWEKGKGKNLAQLLKSQKKLKQIKR